LIFDRVIQKIEWVMFLLAHSVAETLLLVLCYAVTVDH